MTSRSIFETMNFRFHQTMFLLCGLAATASVGYAEEKISYNDTIRPIFNATCVGCHGGVKKSAGVSFIYREAALGVSANGNRVIIPGDPENSELIKRITSDDPRYVMPPAEGDHHHEPLSHEQIEQITEWIRQGAEWEEHWAYIPPVKRKAKPGNSGWGRKPMDGYVLERLDDEGLSPTQEAPRSQWLRRATFDLTGLPPSPEELETFLADESPDAYEKVVDRLLASPRYGERWAGMWMDLARYADTVGYEKDNVREMWQYRDWLINAFNEDLPYPEFVRDQLAGDLVEKPTTDQLVATAFLRLTATNDEGGTDDEEFRVAAVIDRINTSWVSFQGLSFGCVQCHGHPYEPIPHEDYYKFMALLNNTEDCDQTDEFPRHLIANDPGQRQTATDAQLQVLELKRQRNEPGRLEMKKAEPWIQPSYDNLFISAGSLHQKDGVLFTSGTQPAHVDYTVVLKDVKEGAPVTALKVSILPDTDKPEDAPFRGSVLSQLILNKKSLDGKVSAPLTIQHVYVDGLAGPYEPHHALNPSASGVGGFPKLFKKREAVFVLKEPVSLQAGETLVANLKCRSATSGNQAVTLRKFQLQLSTSEAWQKLVSNEAHQQVAKQMKEVQDVLKFIKGIEFPVALNRPPESSRETRMFIGGNWLNKGDVQGPGVPVVLNPYKAPAGSRLEMAEWMTHPENSLAARVFVNRLFSELFGNGIVRTLGDFGSSGLPPSNLPLLDYLAVSFSDDCQWRMKPLLKEMVLSATYRQDHKSTSELSTRDPKNLLLARGPRTRLTAEMIRDNALAVSGLIAHRDGGPSVMPPQPEGVWNAPYSNRKWKIAEGPDRYRRALYTFWSRSSPYPSMLTFDAPARDICNIQRITTNTPLQPLVTMNDPVYLECAQEIAGRMKKIPEADIQAKIAHAHWLTTQREATDLSLGTLETFYHDLLQEYQTTPFKNLGENAEEAALVNLASILLNIDSALTK